MADVAVLGAGYMGSAITFPICENGHGVRLWGTWLDDELVEAAKEGDHPRLHRRLPERVRLFYANELEEALYGIDFLIIAVTSEGFLPVFGKTLENLEQPLPFFTVTKGFVEYGGEVLRVSEGARRHFMQRFRNRDLQWVSVGGPVKAVELSNEIPTATVFGYNTPAVARFFSVFPTNYYRVFSVQDVRGVELSSALKNVYAIGIGICDGVYGRTDVRYCHNFKAFIFNQSVREMALLVGERKGERETVFDLAGVGDLYVTSASGRNGMFGRRVGAGGVPEQEYRSMLDAGEVAEGYHTLRLLLRYISQKGDGNLKKLPLLETIQRVILEGKDPREELFRFAERCGGNG